MGTLFYSNTEEENKPVVPTKNTEEIVGEPLELLTFDGKDELIVQSFEEEVERPENEE